MDHTETAAEAQSNQACACDVAVKNSGGGGRLGVKCHPLLQTFLTSTELVLWRKELELLVSGGWARIWRGA
jgi:hypothetical protein